MNTNILQLIILLAKISCLYLWQLIKTKCVIYYYSYLARSIHIAISIFIISMIVLCCVLLGYIITNHILVQSASNSLENSVSQRTETPYLPQQTLHHQFFKTRMLIKELRYMMEDKATQMAKQGTPVVITVYHPLEGQTDGTPLITASQDTIIFPITYRWLAVSRDLEKMGFTMGSSLALHCECPFKGIWTIKDRMNKRWKQRIDLLLPPNTPLFKGEGTILRYDP